MLFLRSKVPVWALYVLPIVSITVALVVATMFGREFAGTIVIMVVGTSAVLSFPLGLYFFIRSAILRLAIFVGGAMLVMQTDGGLSVPKMAYFAAVATCALISLSRLRQLKKSEWWAPFAPAVLGAGILLVLIFVSAIVSIAGGETPVRVARDALTYLLICVAPIVGLDGASQAGPKAATRFTMIFSGVGAVGFAVFWLSRRGVSTLSLDRFVMASMMLAGVAVLLGVIKGLTPKIRPVWLLFGIFALGCVLITGTRTGLVIVVALLGAAGVQRKFRIPPVRLLSGLGIIGLATYLILPWATSRVASEEFFQSRLSVFSSTLTDGAGADASGSIRQLAYSYAIDIWSANPILGVGLGYSFPNPNVGAADADFQLDTPLLYFAKFGIVGTIVIIISLSCFAITARRMHTTLGIWSAEQTIFLAFACVWLLILPFGTPTEDKGFALSLALLFFMMGARARSAVTCPFSIEPPVTFLVAP